MPDERPSLPDGLRKLASLSASTALVLALSFAIAWPIWSFATGSRRVYTIVVGAAIVLVAAAAVIAARKRSR